MHSKSVRIVAITVAALLFGVVTDRASSHNLSRLAVSAFHGAIGTGIELVAPSANQVAGRQRAAGANSAPSFEPIARLQSPALAEASAIQATEPESATVDGAVASAEPQVQPDHTVASSLFGQPANASVRAGRAPSSGGGGGAGSGGVSAASNREASATAAETSESEPPAARLDGLMDLVMSELDSDGGYHMASVGSSSDFKKSDFKTTSASNPKAPAPATAPSGSSASESSPADSTKSPAFEQASGSIPEAPYSPTLPSDVAFAEGGGGFAADPEHSLVQIVNELLPLPSDAPLEIVALASGDPLLGLVSPVTAPDFPFAATETPMIVNPEPATLLLFGTGLALVARRVRRGRT